MIVFIYTNLAHGRWFSPGTPASSTTKTGRHDIAEILLSGVKHQKSNQSIITPPLKQVTIVLGSYLSYSKMTDNIFKITLKLQNEKKTIGYLDRVSHTFIDNRY